MDATNQYRTGSVGFEICNCAKEVFKKFIAKKIYIILLLVLLLAGCFSDKGEPRFRHPHISSARPRVWSDVSRVVIIVLENTDFDQASNQPFLKRLIQEGALLSSYYAITHPSQPN
jgi:hypothetical protein